MKDTKRKSKGGWETLSSKIVHENPFYEIQKDELIFPNKKKGEYFIVKKGDAVCIVPIENDKIIFVRQYRYVFNNWFLELPCGGVDTNLTTVYVAKKELHEETGYESDDIQEVGKFTTVNGSMNEYMYVFIARGLKFVGQKLESSEQGMEVVEIEIDKVYKMIEDGEIKDGQTISALMLAKKYIT